MENPFYCGDKLPLGRFIGRKNLFRRLVSQVSKGSSTLIVGDPRVGKTSFLAYLSAETKRQAYGKIASRIWFQYIDLQPFNGLDPAQFWSLTITPLYEAIFKDLPDSPVLQAYSECSKDKFVNLGTLEGFFEQLDILDWRLVLLVDEFDVILEHPKLNTKDFLGSFRSLATRYPSFSSVIAARETLNQLNDKTKSLSRGSPYFNYYQELILGPLKDKESATLLNWAGERFTSADRRYIVELTGGHPYLLQVAASELWEAYIELPGDAYKRWQKVEDKLYRAVASTFDDMWRLWSPKMRMAFTAAVLPQITSNYPRFKIQNLLIDLREFDEELRELEARGLIVADRKSNSQWRARSLATLWWLANKVADAVHTEISYKEWLQKQQIENGVVTREQKKQWNEAWRALGEVLKNGTKTFIEASSKGFGEVVTEKLSGGTS